MSTACLIAQLPVNPLFDRLAKKRRKLAIRRFINISNDAGYVKCFGLVFWYRRANECVDVEASLRHSLARLFVVFHRV